MTEPASLLDSMVTAVIAGFADPSRQSNWQLENVRVEHPLSVPEEANLTFKLFPFSEFVAQQRRDLLLFGPESFPPTSRDVTMAQEALLASGLDHARSLWLNGNPIHRLAAGLSERGESVLHLAPPPDYPRTWCPCCVGGTLEGARLHARLHMHVSDPVRVLPYNVFEFTGLFAAVAAWAGLALGTLQFSADLVTIRDSTDREMARSMLRAGPSKEAASIG